MIGSRACKPPIALPVLAPRPAGRAAGDERRRARRTAVGWHGRVLIGQSPSVECAILNVSLRGAKLRLRLPIDLPGGFVLSIARFGELHCEVLEQEQAIVRVGFIDPPRKIQEFFRHQLPQSAEDDAQT